MDEQKTLRIGTRGSALARWQADWVAARLRERSVSVEMVYISTHGDQQQIASIGEIGSQGVFTKELQRALLDGRIDLSVHSLKDLPTEPVEGLCLTAVPERASVRDLLITRDGRSLEELSPGEVVGTGSLRRQSQLLELRPDLKVADIRGNVDTRLRKLADGEYDAIVLAEAGLERLALKNQIQFRPFDPSQMVPAVGQGALGLECRDDDSSTRATLSALDHQPSHWAVRAERTLLAALRGGCLAPVGAWARLNRKEQLILDAVVLARDGSRRIAVQDQAVAANAAELGQRVAEQLLALGAADLIQQSRFPSR